ncbi:MAG: hypothetical protein ACLQVD_07880 [Capsulimonadaceae bacterium]
MLPNHEILASPIVANSLMNRGRGLAGVNSLARELGFDPLEYLLTRVVRPPAAKRLTG